MPSMCSVPNCRGNYKKGPKVHVFGFPKNEELRKKWLTSIRRHNFTPTQYSNMCDCHFEPHLIRWTSSAFDDKTGRTITCALPKPALVEGAVPSILPNCPAYLSPPSVKPRKSRDEKAQSTEESQLAEAIETSADAFGEERE
ncbi:hypothetical protein CAPTEDRAFT_214260, partial [Capitella teleta]